MADASTIDIRERPAKVRKRGSVAGLFGPPPSETTAEMHGDSQRMLPLALKAVPRSKRRRTEAEHPVDDVTAWDKAIEAHQFWQQRAECPSSLANCQS